MKKQCTQHKDLPIEFICFHTLCQNHLACSKCLIEIHNDHVDKCFLYEFINKDNISIETDLSNEFQQEQMKNFMNQKLRDQPNTQKQIDIKRQFWKFNSSFIDQIASQIECLEESLIDSFNICQSPIKETHQEFLNQYKYLTNITEIKYLFKSLNQLSKEEFIKKLDDLLQNYQSKSTQLKITYYTLIKQNFSIDIISQMRLTQKFIEQIKNYQSQFIAKNSFQIIGSQEHVQELKQNTEQVLQLAVYNKIFTKNRKYKIILEFNEFQINQSSIFYIGFTRDNKIDSEMDVFKEGSTYVASLAQYQDYTYVTEDSDIDSALGMEIQQDLKKQTNNQKSSKLELILNLKDIEKSIIIKFNKHTLKYNRKCQILAGGNEESAKYFFNSTNYKLYIQYQGQKFKCTATHQLIE